MVYREGFIKTGVIDFQNTGYKMLVRFIYWHDDMEFTVQELWNEDGYPMHYIPSEALHPDFDDMVHEALWKLKDEEPSGVYDNIEKQIEEKIAQFKSLNK